MSVCDVDKHQGEGQMEFFFIIIIIFLVTGKRFLNTMLLTACLLLVRAGRLVQGMLTSALMCTNIYTVLRYRHVHIFCC